MLIFAFARPSLSVDFAGVTGVAFSWGVPLAGVLGALVLPRMASRASCRLATAVACDVSTLLVCRYRVVLTCVIEQHVLAIWVCRWGFVGHIC